MGCALREVRRRGVEKAGGDEVAENEIWNEVTSKPSARATSEYLGEEVARLLVEVIVSESPSELLEVTSIESPFGGTEGIESVVQHSEAENTEHGYPVLEGGIAIGRKTANESVNARKAAGGWEVSGIGTSNVPLALGFEK